MAMEHRRGVNGLHGRVDRDVVLVTMFKVATMDDNDSDREDSECASSHECALTVGHPWLIGGALHASIFQSHLRAEAVRQRQQDQDVCAGLNKAALERLAPRPGHELE